MTAPLIGAPASTEATPGAENIRVGVVTFPGTLDDRDAMRAVKLSGATAVNLWHADSGLSDVDAVILPGGFSYGDYLRCGAIARFAPIMDSVIDAANGGMPVLGICNGFQVLCEAHLLPGGLIRNDHQQFICRDQKLRVENTNTAWTNMYGENEEIVIPLKNGEGGYMADDHVLDELEESGRVVFRYLDVNPNGSRRDIAGITNERGNVVGLMPHPEHAVEAGFGADTAAGIRTGVDGQNMFVSVLKSLLNA
ncbi:phosphoribosylformylglycinamidine synthase subunit PurQ [Brevibacterium samyangense]|uniref:Phosphoribosylformylglycinamidine synthase subunit PurQ n=1 Tax=Brevibacterium samyangense TaxID=366888 RepID=A0ABN2TKU2_9MICO